LVEGASACEREDMGHDAQLRREYYRAFRRWLQLTLAQQCEDVEVLVSRQPVAGRRVLIRWMQSGGHCALVPREANPPERELFLGDLEIVLEIVTGDRER
jgi:hypothetical protein